MTTDPTPDRPLTADELAAYLARLAGRADVADWDRYQVWIASRPWTSDPKKPKGAKTP